jgi:hypothetical protein
MMRVVEALVSHWTEGTLSEIVAHVVPGGGAL